MTTLLQLSDTHIAPEGQLVAGRLETGAPAPELSRAVNTQMAYAFCTVAEVMERESRLELALAHAHLALLLEPESYIAMFMTAEIFGRNQRWPIMARMIDHPSKSARVS